jgi:HEAT repeat protein
MLRAVAIVLLLAPAGCHSPSAPVAPDDEGVPPTEADVRLLARGQEAVNIDFLVEYGRAAFPAYATILADSTSDPREVAGVLSALFRHQGPKGQFRTLVAPLLAHPDGSVRRLAIKVVGQLGTPAEGSALIALLSDENTVIAHTAAQALAETGGPGEVVAMNAWLLGVAHRCDDALRDRVRRCRDQLDARLRGVAIVPAPREKK